MKTSLREDIMSDLNKLLAKNQKVMLKLLTPTVKKLTNLQNFEDSDSETENAHPTSIAQVKSKTTTSKTTLLGSRNRVDEPKLIKSSCELDKIVKLGLPIKD